MNKLITTVTIGTLSLAALLSSAIADERGETVARAYFGLKDPVTVRSSATMTLTDKKGATRNRSLEMYERKDSKGTASFIEFSAPADVKGTRFLNLPLDNGSSEQRIYLPALKKVRLIASSGKKGKFVGSEFSFYDMEDRDFDDYTYTFLREEKLGERTCNVVSMTQKDASAPYSHAEAWADVSDSFVYQLKLYDRAGGGHIKTLSVIETQIYDGCIIPVKARMTNVVDNTSTDLVLHNVEVNGKVDEKLFTLQNLEAK